MSINLLPWREIRNKKRSEKLMIGLVIYILIIFSGITLLKNFLAHKTAHLSFERTRIENNIQKITLNHSSQHAILLKKLKLSFTKKSVSAAENNKIIHFLSVIATDLPNDTTLHSLSFSNKKVILSGMSNQLSDIHQYIIALQKNTAWENIQLSEMHTDPSNQLKMDFTIQGTL